MTVNLISNLLIQDQGPLFEHKQLISVGSTEGLHLLQGKFGGR